MPRNLTTQEWLAGLVAITLVAALMWHFHDRYWWPPDEGIYAYIAERMLAGDVLHRDLIDIHPGLVNIIHVAAFEIFGMDLVSLRYPLVGVTLIQCWLVFLILAERGTLISMVGVIGVGALSFIQFLNPSANWYALGIFFLAVFVLYRRDARARQTALIAGLLVGLCFMTRQLSAVFLAMGIVTWMLAAPTSSDEDRGARWVPVLIGGVMAVGLIWYVTSKNSLLAWAMTGLWPLLMAGRVALHARMTPREAGGLMVSGVAGFTLACLPIVVWMASQGVLAEWFDDIVWTAFSVHRQPFIDDVSMWTLIERGFQHIVVFDDPVAVFSGFAWIALLGLMPMAGFLALRRPGLGGPPAILGVFWMSVAIHYEIPIYFFFGVPAAVLTVLWLTQTRRTTCLTILVLSIWAVGFQAGQPVSRGWDGIAAGQRNETFTPARLPRASLMIETYDRDVYQALLIRIKRVALPDEPLMTLPSNPELNFITGRRTPVDYYATGLGVFNEADVGRTIARLQAAAPLFVVFRRRDTYFDPLTAAILRHVEAFSSQPEQIGHFRLYRYHGPDVPRQ